MVAFTLKLALLVLVACTFVESLPTELQDNFAEAEQDDSNKEYTAEENLDNNHVTEGDIYLDKSTKEIIQNLENNGRDAVTNPVKHWPRGRVPYVFGSVSSSVRQAWQAAVNDYNRYTCIRLVPRRSERDYIYVVSEGGCWSAIGRSGGRQKLSLGRGCEHKGTTIHEIMHALGFFHEQSRLDRDNYISIQWGNIRRGMEYNFKKYRHGQADYLGASYDYGSVMHYPAYAFSNNRQKTIVSKRSGVQLGQRNGFSEIDKYQINKLYKCGGSVKPTQPRPKPPTRPPVVSCSDKNRSCPGWARGGYCRTNRYVQTNCKKSCGTCGGVSTCQDKKSNCPGWRRYCRSYRYSGFMTRNCKKTCGKC